MTQTRMRAWSVVVATTMWAATVGGPSASGSTVAPTRPTTVGEPSATGAADWIDCQNDLTHIQLGPGYRTPRGVLTSYRIATGDGLGTRVSFKVARRAGPVWPIVGSTPLTPVEPYGVVTGATRIPVRAGDAIGAYYESEVGCAVHTGAGSDALAVGPGNLQVGDAAGAPGAGIRLGLSAQVEPDGDRDGFGDLSQDGCAADPTTRRGCATSAPRTRIVESKTARKGRVVVLRLAASEPATFRCRVGDGVARACRTLFRVRLGPGRHIIRVQAVDRYGNVDATPAVQRVRVRRGSQR